MIVPKTILERLDRIAATLRHAGDIADFQDRDRTRRPWIQDLA